MRVSLVAPLVGGIRTGNRVTATRWAKRLRELGHHVQLGEFAPSCDVLIALHARKSADAIEQFRAARPTAPLVVALSGTDVYGDGDDTTTLRSLAAATRIVALNDLAANALPAELRGKVRVIHQSAAPS